MKKILVGGLILFASHFANAQHKDVNYYLCLWGPEFKLEVPNVFTPNHDFVNDHFVPKVDNEICIDSYYMVIYNRWGQQVFETNVYSVGWDGNNLYGQPYPDGSYCYSLVYKISQANEKPKTITQKGVFLLNR